MPKYTVRRLNLGRDEQYDQLALAAGELYSRTLITFWRVVRKKGLWLGQFSLTRWQKSKEIHSQSAQAVTESFFASLKSWRKRRKQDPRARPPRRKKKFYKVQWKTAAIKLEGNKLRLSNGKANPPLYIPWKWDKPKLVELGWTGEQYQIRAIYVLEDTQVKPLGNKVVGIDLGEIHLAVSHDGEQCHILNGRKFRSVRRYQNKLKAELSHMIDTKKRGSNHRKRLVRSKRRQLKKIEDQMTDILHKQTTRLISTLYSEGVQILVIGDLRDIRKDLDYGRKANQKIHQMVSGKVRWMLSYKAERLGMKVVLQNEAYTTQTCPACGKRKKPAGRMYRCPCGFSYHRDGVGALNIRAKYLEENTPVVGVMASPIGLRWRPHVRCSLDHTLVQETS